MWLHTQQLQCVDSLAARLEDSHTLLEHASHLSLPISAVHQAVQSGFVHNGIHASVLYCTCMPSSVILAVCICKGLLFGSACDFPSSHLMYVAASMVGHKPVDSNSAFCPVLHSQAFISHPGSVSLQRAAVWSACDFPRSLNYAC